jgi:2-polyprenyl-3-methyl-5-hydroxy-6-metoxy-1,4-benzoquinol methylase
VLDVGGGQLALLTKALWGDRSVAADIGGEHLGYLESVGVSTAAWNLCSDPSPFENRFDVIFFSEVIEHLPLPGHEVLEKLKHAARPGALLICTTPNLYRLRNIAFMLTGRQIFDHFRMPKEHGLGHVLEYSRDHLAWQLDRAGWHDAEIEFVQIPHAPVERMHRVLYRLGSPLFMVPRFRDTLVATARA